MIKQKILPQDRNQNPNRAAPAGKNWSSSRNQNLESNQHERCRWTTVKSFLCPSPLLSLESNLQNVFSYVVGVVDFSLPFSKFKRDLHVVQFSTFDFHHSGPLLILLFDWFDSSSSKHHISPNRLRFRIQTSISFGPILHCWIFTVKTRSELELLSNHKLRSYQFHFVDAQIFFRLKFVMWCLPVSNDNWINRLDVIAMANKINSLQKATRNEIFRIFVQFLWHWNSHALVSCTHGSM